MKLEVLVANEEALKVLVETKFDDAQLAWDLAESFDEVEKAITKFHKMRDDYVKENGKPTEDAPDRFSIADPEAFSKEMQRLLAVEVDITFPAFALDKLKGLKVSVKEMRSWKALGIISNGKPVAEEAPVEEVEEVKDNPNT